MTPIEKIRAEIERLKRQSQEDLQRPEVQGFVIYELVERVKQKTCEQLLSFIASLEVEKHKEQQPAGWSEEDENAFLFLYVLIDSGFTEKFINAQKASDMKKWLNTRFKSIRPPHWKPSEEQMAALKKAQYMMSQSGDYYDTTAIINSLITDLQKLL